MTESLKYLKKYSDIPIFKKRFGVGLNVRGSIPGDLIP